MISLSNSELTCFKRCRREWFLHYYLGFSASDEQTGPVGPLHLGSRVHVALEGYYGYQADPLDVLDQLYALARERWEDTDEELRQEHALAQIMLEGYLDWVRETGADELLEVVATERELEVESGLPGVRFRGRLDQVVRRRDTGVRGFLDHKTAASLAGLEQSLTLAEQPRFYAMLLMLEKVQTGHDERVDGVVFNVLRKCKRTAKATPPFYARYEPPYNLEDLRSMYLRSVAVARELAQARERLDAGGDHREVVYPTPVLDCSWRCPFYLQCAMLDDGSRWEAALADRFMVRDPYAHYREGYAELRKEGVIK